MKAGIKAGVVGLVLGLAISASTAGADPIQGTEACCIACEDFYTYCTGDLNKCAETVTACINWCQCP